MGVSQKPVISLFLHYESAVINATAEEGSLSFIVSQQEHRSWVPHSIWLQHRPDIHLASSISSYHGLQHGLRWQYRSQTPIRTLAAVQRTDVIMASGGSTSHRHCKAFGSTTGHGCGWTKDSDMAPGVSRPQISPGPPAGVRDDLPMAAHASDIGMVRRLSTASVPLHFFIVPTANSHGAGALKTASHYSAHLFARISLHANAHGTGLTQSLCSLKHHKYQVIATTSLITAVLQVFTFSSHDMLPDPVWQHQFLLEV